MYLIKLTLLAAYITDRSVLHPGYQAFTCMEMELDQFKIDQMIFNNNYGSFLFFMVIILSK